MRFWKLTSFFILAWRGPYKLFTCKAHWKLHPDTLTGYTYHLVDVDSWHQQAEFFKVNCWCGQAAPYYFPWVNVILQFSSRPLGIVVSSNYGCLTQHKFHGIFVPFVVNFVENILNRKLFKDLTFSMDTLNFCSPKLSRF